MVDAPLVEVLPRLRAFRLPECPRVELGRERHGAAHLPLGGLVDRLEKLAAPGLPRGDQPALLHDERVAVSRRDARMWGDHAK